MVIYYCCWTMLLMLLIYVVLRALWKIDVYLISTLVNNKSLYLAKYKRPGPSCFALSVMMSIYLSRSKGWRIVRSFAIGLPWKVPVHPYGLCVRHAVIPRSAVCPSKEAYMVWSLYRHLSSKYSNPSAYASLNISRNINYAKFNESSQTMRA